MVNDRLGELLDCDVLSLHRINGGQIHASEAQILHIAIADTSMRIRPSDETNRFFRVPDLRPTF
jgi:hypothetical protein